MCRTDQLVKITQHICKEDNPHIISTHDAFLPHSVLDNKPLQWDECDVQNYQNSLEILLEKIFENWNAPENLQILATTIPHAFIQAAEASVPCQEYREPNFKIKKSTEWLKAETNASKAKRKWCRAGKPVEADDPILMRKNKPEPNSEMQ